MRRKWIFIAPAGILAMALFTFLGGEVVKLLWNALLPSLFGFPTITFWQAFGLLALSRILVGGFGLGGGSRSHIRRRMMDRVADRVGDRWDRMSDEERTQFRQRMRERCGFDPSTGASRDL